ncbi:MAG: hypothetical protein HOD58_08165 [Gammaproteobacteria bacterium]|nr:hypothetical protein [Gammaproteobacteria bacterium]
MALLLTLFSASTLALTEFSADVTYLDAAQNHQRYGRLYVSDDAIREERYHEVDQKAYEVKIIDLFRGVTLRADLQRGEYQQLNEVVTMPRNPAQFCAEAPLLSCGFQQRERLQQRVVERWAAELGFSSLSIEITAWYDPEIQYPVRLQMSDGETLQLSNVEVGRLPSATFSLPFDLRRVAKLEGIAVDNFSLWP